MTIVTIPTLGTSPYLLPLLEHVLADSVVKEVLLTVNLPNIDLDHVKNVDDRIQVVDLSDKGVSIYHGWRYAIHKAKWHNTYLTILNDDITFTCENPITNGIAHFVEDPNLAVLGFNYREAVPNSSLRSYIWGSYRHGGVSGAAFMVDPVLCAEPDPRYCWWFGDDSLFIDTSNRGKAVAIANYLTYDHVSETTARNHQWTFDARHKDIELWREQHGPDSF